MVGDPIRSGGGTTELTTALRADYDAVAADWVGGATGRSGPGSMYEPLARSLVAAAPVPLAGRLVLDLGAGTGVAGRAALAAGARRVVGADLSEGMLRRGRGESTVNRVSSQSCSSSSCILRRVSASSAANGSSMSRMSGSIAMPRAIATRCFMPPERVCG